jgi:hypothetical protein
MRLLIPFLLAYAALASTTTVQQTIIGPDSQPTSGKAFIRISAACQSGSNYVGEKTIVVPFTGGAFSVALVPNDTCAGQVAAGSTSYTVAWLLNGGMNYTETWYVPTSATPVSVASVIVNASVTPVGQINPSQLSQAGATLMQPLCWLGTVWGPGACGGGGSGGGATIPSVTNLIKGDGSGNGADSGIAPSTVVVTSGNYSNPSWITGLAYSKLTGAPTTWAWANLTGIPSFATVATSGSYLDLSNKPTIPAAQVNSDWNAGSGVAQILNKPALPANTSSVAHQWFSAYNSATGAFSQAQPACGDLSNAAASCSTDATNASNIGSGTLNHARLPALLSGDIPANAANTSGSAASLSAASALPSGTTATTQSQADSSTKVATTAYVDTGLGGKAASNASTTVNGQACALGSTCAVTASLPSTPTKCSAGNYPLGVDANGNAQNCTAASTGGPRPLNGPGTAAKCQGGVCAVAFSYATSGAPSAAAEADGINGNVDFTASTLQTVYDRFDLPTDWAGTLKVNITAWSSSTSAPTINLYLSCISTGAISGPAFGSAQSISLTPSGSSGRTLVTTTLQTSATYATNACAAGNLVEWQLAITANAAADLHVLSVRFTE